MPIERERAKNLTDESIRQVVETIDAWSEPKLTWELLIKKIKKRLNTEYTRQALSKHERILRAYQDRKKAIATYPNKSVSVETGDKKLDEALAKIRQLNAAVERLEAENNRLLEQFILWRYNAEVKKLSVEYLSQPLPDPQDSNTDNVGPKQGSRKAVRSQKST